MIDKRELQTLAGRISETWSSDLSGIRENFMENQETVFSSLVGFIGIQVLLWQGWIHSFSVPDSLRSVLVEKASEDTMPWLCFSVPYHKNVLLVLLSTSGVLEERRIFKELLLPSFCQMMRSLNNEGKVIRYAKAYDVLLQLGHDITRAGDITMPLLDLEKFDTQWNSWVCSTIKPKELIDSYAMSKKNIFHDNESIESFRIFSQLLWEQLVQREIVTTRRTKKRYLPRIFHTTSNEYFTGCLIIYGDHRKFWEKRIINSES